MTVETPGITQDCTVLQAEPPLLSFEQCQQELSSRTNIILRDKLEEIEKTKAAILESEKQLQIITQDQQSKFKQLVDLIAEDFKRKMEQLDAQYKRDVEKLKQDAKEQIQQAKSDCETNIKDQANLLFFAPLEKQIRNRAETQEGIKVKQACLLKNEFILRDWSPSPNIGSSNKKYSDTQPSPQFRKQYPACPASPQSRYCSDKYNNQWQQSQMCRTCSKPLSSRQSPAQSPRTLYERSPQRPKVHYAQRPIDRFQKQEKKYNYQSQQCGRPSSPFSKGRDLSAARQRQNNQPYERSRKNQIGHPYKLSRFEIYSLIDSDDD